MTRFCSVPLREKSNIFENSLVLLLLCLVVFSFTTQISLFNHNTHLPNNKHLPNNTQSLKGKSQAFKLVLLSVDRHRQHLPLSLSKPVHDGNQLSRVSCTTSHPSSKPNQLSSSLHLSSTSSSSNESGATLQPALTISPKAKWPTNLKQQPKSLPMSR